MTPDVIGDLVALGIVLAICAVVVAIGLFTKR